MSYMKLTDEQKTIKINTVRDYCKEGNAATKSDFDPNANVTHKNICTLQAELNKDINIQVNREIMYERIESLFDIETADEYIRQIKDHEIYVHDETNLAPYCVAISLYPFICNGLKSIGGLSEAPKHLDSFCGSFINLIYAISSQFSGAVGIPEALVAFDYYARKDYGDNYLEEQEEKIANSFQQWVYSLNQPAGSRAYQSPFTNFAIFDEQYFNTIFDGFSFPDGDVPKWSTLNKLQEFFLNWFREEREKKVLTFPVVTASLLNKDGDVADEQVVDYLCEQQAKGLSFFSYQSDSADSLSSCCRLRNGITDSVFSNSFGAGGVSTGSINVITINVNRHVQQGLSMKETVQKLHKYQVAYRSLMDDYLEANMMPVYNAGYITLDKQYLTVGVNGVVEAAEFLGIEIKDNDAYREFFDTYIGVITRENKKAKEEYGYMFNLEFVPAENLGVKNAKWDKEAGLQVNRDCYNSYVYKVEDHNVNIVDKFKMHGRDFTEFMDGGSALHLNLDEHPTKEQYRQFYKIAAQEGCNYWTTNIPNTVCNECGHVDVRFLKSCSKCESKDVDYATRVIGYLKKITNFSKDRQIEADLRVYHKKEVHNIR